VSKSRLPGAHFIALVLNPATDEIRMANPFSAVPTAYRVHAGGRWWYGNWAWDAIGICAALRTDGHIETSCPDCGEAISFGVRGQRPDDERLRTPRGAIDSPPTGSLTTVRRTRRSSTSLA